MYRVWGLGFRVQGLAFRVWVQGLGCSVLDFLELGSERGQGLQAFEFGVSDFES